MKEPAGDAGKSSVCRSESEEEKDGGRQRVWYGGVRVRRFSEVVAVIWGRRCIEEEGLFWFKEG